MPKAWYDRHAALKIEDPDTREFYLRIIADKKPSFMRYIYPDLARQYNNYVKNSDRKAQREFGKTVAELLESPTEDLTEEESSFLRYYKMMMPVGLSPCVMNRICTIFENEFDGVVRTAKEEHPFDYTIMKSGAAYTKTQYNKVLRLFEEYNRRLKDYSVFAARERIEKDDASIHALLMRDEFRALCDKAIPEDEVLCDIVLDICYQRSATKQFAWDMCGEQIIHNLIANGDGAFHVPVAAEDGDFTYAGERFKLVEKRMEGSDADLSE